MAPSGTVIYCVLTLFAGGLLKGIAGLGLPLIGMPLLTLAISLKSALGVLVVPLIASNLVQSFQGGLFHTTLRRFWPLLLVLFVVVAVSTKALVIVPERYLFPLIGLTLILFSTAAYLRPAIKLSPAQERWVAPLVGIIAGVIGGISGFYGPALMLYLVWLRLSKETFVVAVSLLLFVGAVGLALGLLLFGATRPDQLGLSALACVPVFLGMWLGQRIRLRMSERRFAGILLVTYLATGASFIVKVL